MLAAETVPASQPARMQQAALDALARGWSVIPIAAGGKRPLIPWRVFQTRPARPDEVRAWFQRWPQANLALVTGARSGLVVIDVDPRHGGTASLAAQQAAAGPLPATLSAASGGGGRHLYFAHPGGRIGNRTGLRPGLDLRGDGGYIVAPPSRHASGEPYRWTSAPTAALAPLPTWLIPAARPRPGRTRAEWQALLRAGVAEGARNNGIASLAGHLLHHGVDPSIALELLLSWNQARCRPPLTDAEVARTLESVRRTRARHA